MLFSSNEYYHYLDVVLGDKTFGDLHEAVLEQRHEGTVLAGDLSAEALYVRQAFGINDPNGAVAVTGGRTRYAGEFGLLYSLSDFDTADEGAAAMLPPEATYDAALELTDPSGLGRALREEATCGWNGVEVPLRDLFEIPDPSLVTYAPRHGDLLNGPAPVAGLLVKKKEHEYQREFRLLLIPKNPPCPDRLMVTIPEPERFWSWSDWSRVVEPSAVPEQIPFNTDLREIKTLLKQAERLGPDWPTLLEPHITRIKWRSRMECRVFMREHWRYFATSNTFDFIAVEQALAGHGAERPLGWRPDGASSDT